MALFFTKCKVEVSTNGTTWTDVSSSMAAVEMDGGERDVGSVTAFGQDYPSVGVGPRKEVKVKLKVIYDEGTSGAFETLRAAYENGTNVYVRWSPLGGTSGKFQYATDPGYVTVFSYPSGESESANPILVEVEVVTPKVTKSVVA